SPSPCSSPGWSSPCPAARAPARPDSTGWARGYLLGSIANLRLAAPVPVLAGRGPRADVGVVSGEGTGDEAPLRPSAAHPAGSPGHPARPGAVPDLLADDPD